MTLTYNVFSGTLNPTQSFLRTVIVAQMLSNEGKGKMVPKYATKYSLARYVCVTGSLLTSASTLHGHGTLYHNTFGTRPLFPSSAEN